jgi:hypothetical protein
MFRFAFILCFSPLSVSMDGLCNLMYHDQSLPQPFYETTVTILGYPVNSSRQDCHKTDQTPHSVTELLLQTTRIHHESDRY